MDFADSPEHAAFRAEFRRWLEENLPHEICVDDAADQRVAPDHDTLEKRIAWQKKMHAAGWVGISWPKEYGGRGASFMQQVIFDEEYFRARAPVLPAASALNLLGPTLIHWGTEEQKRRHLPRILSADALLCQGYSEPDAGGDLASLRTRAVDRGDHFVVNGQKVWTSGAHFADWCFLLVRTDPDAPKHHGISYLLVDMKTPGITVRPLVLLNGHRHFNEVFFEDVVVPKVNLVGPLNEGWKVAITTLMFERSGAGGRDHAAQIARLTELAKQFPTRQEPAWKAPSSNCSARNWRCGLPISLRPCSALTRPSMRRRRQCPTRLAGTTACWAPANTRSPAAPARSSATSSASAYWDCRRASCRWPLTLTLSPLSGAREPISPSPRLRGEGRGEGRRATGLTHGHWVY
jgi:hypothetical protein